MPLDISSLEQRLGCSFKNKNMLVQSLVHRSYINEHPQFELGHNERLEFLGDAVLELIVTEYLYQHYPNPEGELTNWRAALVNARTLSDIAKHDLQLEPYLYMSRGESKELGKARMYILANAIEAVLGAVYLDQGYERTKEIIHRYILSRLDDILSKKLYLDPKTKFQESAQEKLNLTPTYQVLEESGPDHAKNFKVGVYLGADLVASGDGASKQEAQVEAAENALRVKGW